MNVDDGLGPSVNTLNTHVFFLLLLIVVGVENGLGPSVYTHPRNICFW